MINFAKELNEQQYAAATNDAKYLRIIAGAGTGKTRALTYRVAYLLASRNIDPRKLVAFSFTNKVAKEMGDRVRKILQDANLDITYMPIFSTYHSFCVRFLRSEITCLKGFTRQFTIVDEDDQKKYLKDTATTLNISNKSLLYDMLVDTLSKVKCRGLLPDEVQDIDIEYPTLKLNQFLDFYRTYQKLLKKSNSLDFDDILIFTYDIMRSNPKIKKKYHQKFNVFLVDEYQDTNDLQYKLLKEFLSPEAQLTVVGDPDQTIYTWRGADGELIKSVLKQDFPSLETVVLSKNYRSTQTILDTANKLISHNPHDEESRLIAASGLVGEDIDFKRLPSADLEAQYISTCITDQVARKRVEYKNIAIIYRSNYLSRAIETALTLKGIPYRIFGGLRFYDRAVIKDALAYLKILINPYDDASVLRILKAPTRGMGQVALANIIDFAEQNQLSLLETIIEHSEELEISKKSKISLLSFRKSLEQILIALNDKEFETDDITGIIRDYYDGCGFSEYVNNNDRKKEEKEGKDIDRDIDDVNELITNISNFFHQPLESSISLDDEEIMPSDAANILNLFLANVILMSQQDEMNNANAVNLMTVHISKGLEFEEVFVTGLTNGVFPNNHALQSMDNEPLEEERRMLYVAFTRAKRKLHATYFEGYNFVTQSSNTASMFLEEAGLLKKFTYAQTKPSYRPTSSNSSSIRTSNNVSDIQKRLNEINSSKAFGDRKPGQQTSIATMGLTNGTRTKYNYKVGMRVISTSYGIGVVSEVNGDKITALFPDRPGDKKETKFINGGLGFKPYEENKNGSR